MRRLVTPIVLLALLAPAAPALARDRSDELLVDACRDEHVDGTYTQADYAKALRKIPADTDEYTACRDVVRRAQLAAAAGGRRGSGGGSGGSGGGSSSGGGGSAGGGAGSSGGSSAAQGGATSANTGPTPAERKGLDAARNAGAQPVEVAGQLVKPGAAASARHDLPVSVLVMVGLLALAAFTGLGWGAWSRVRERRAG
jgi:cobalamin biosynthesis Mg chelatase CobN